MSALSGDERGVVAMGGVGVSGTRVGAALLQMLGYYIGDDLNESLDNLWFTLLFKRRSILFENERDFRSLVSLFFSRMSGQGRISDEQRAQVLRLDGRDAFGQPDEWVAARTRSLLNGSGRNGTVQPWGWKEPNTHIVAERILECRPELRYLHFVRGPLYMSRSSNQNQLRNWGPNVLGRSVTVNARESLKYWCAAHRRVVTFMRRWPERTKLIDYDAVCDEPGRYCETIAAFLGMEASDCVMSAFRDFVVRPRPADRSGWSDLEQYDPEDLQYVVALGYDLA